MADDALIEQLRAALAATPDNLALRLLLARKLIETGRMADAVETLATLRPEGLDPAQAADLASLLLEAGATDRARAVVDVTRPKGCHSAVFLHAAARVLAATGSFPDAASLWMMAKELDSELKDEKLEALLNEKAPGESSRPPLRVVIGGGVVQKGELPAPPEKQVITFADVGGYDELKKTIHRKIILPFQKPELFIKYGKKAGGGILLYGPPGCGKTHLARATAGECGAVFINVAIEDVLDMWVGQSEKKLHTLFQQARDRAPAVLFIDEIEALGGKRTATHYSTFATLVSQFLSEMDGFNKVNHKVLIMGATNVPWAVDPAFRRPGRFDDVIFVPPPDREAREAILAIMLQGRPVQGVDISSLAGKTSGFSGADLRHLIESAFDLVIEEAISTGREPPLTMDHLSQMLPKIKPTTMEWLSSARNYALYSNEGGQYDDVLEFLKRHGR